MSAATRPNLWLDRRAPIRPRPGLETDIEAEVAIVGAGFTGLWTAYYLRRADPGRRVVVLERDFAGFGASGRNGGWCSDLFPASWPRIATRHGRAAALAQKAAVRASIDEIQRVVDDERIDCDFVRGGTLGFARTPGQLDRARAEVAGGRAWGDTDDDLALLDAAQVRRRCGAVGVLGATFTPHCAALDPGALVAGLAGRVVAAGTRLYEQTTVRRIEPGRVHTDAGTVRADTIIRATEAYTAGLAASHRDIAPVYSLIVATEPLPADVLVRVGLADRPTFTDHRSMISYGQRTADGRLIFGGRGAPYHWGSTIRPEFDADETVFARLRRDLLGLFPALAGVRFTHAWGGPLGIARDWQAGVGLDRRTGLGRAGGYVGDGVSTSNLAGRTLADLILGRDTELTRLPWVDHRSPAWEREPARYLGINAGLRLTRAADRADARGRRFPLAGLLEKLTGH